MPARVYRWDNVLEWLDWKGYLDHIDSGIKMLIQGLDADTIQDQYESEMDEDGYFDWWEENEDGDLVRVPDEEDEEEETDDAG